MSASDLVFHLLDLNAHDQRIENETEETREVVYESGNEEDDDEIENRAARRRAAFTQSGGFGKQREFVIHLFGETADGKTVRADIVGFRPWFYLRLPEERTNEAVESIKQYMAANKIPVGAVNFKKERYESFFGFTARTKFPFLYMDFPSQAMWRDTRGLFLNDKSLPTTKTQLRGGFKTGQCPEVFEANIDPMLRFLHVQNLQPCGWVVVEDGMEAVEDEDGVLTITCDYRAVVPCKTPPRATAPFLVASWDIECYSVTGDFPVAKANGNWKKVAKAIIDGCARDDCIASIKISEILIDMVANNAVKLVKGNGPKSVRGFNVFLESPGFIGALEDVNMKSEDAVLGFCKKFLGGYIEPCGDPVIQIGVSLTRDCKTLDRHLFVWPSCAPCDGITLHVYTDEKAMIKGFFSWIVDKNPDILIGYNVFGFDEKYLWERAEELGCVGESSDVHGLNRLKDLGSCVKLEEKFLSSSALGDNFMYIWSTQGRLQVDLYHYIRRNANLPSYKLDEVTKNYMSGKLKSFKVDGGDLYLELGGAVKDIRPGRAICLLDGIGESVTDKLVILEVVEGSGGGKVRVGCPSDPETVADLADAQKWVVVKDDVSPQDIFRLHRGSAEDRAIVGRYCIQDCDLVVELYKKLEVFNNAMSMANVCSTPISYIFVRGQGIKAESLIFKACRERGILIPVLPAPKQKGDPGEEDSYEGAIVLDPVPGFYHQSPIGVADFASLYPSTIESENISHDSLVWVKDYTYDGDLIGVVFGNDDFAECEGYGYTDIEFDIWRPDPADTRKHPVKIKMGRRVCRYAQPLDGSKSTLPEIIRSLLAARKAKRKEAEKETDPERAALLDAEQLAYKLTGNSLYGQLGSGTFKVRLQHLAASTTAYGRKQIMFAKAVIERFYTGDRDKRCDVKCEAKVVYGDSVTGDTPLPLKIDNTIQFKRIDELLCDSEWSSWHDTKESIDIADKNIQVWTERGFTSVKRLIRHKLAPTKKLYRILTHTGTVDATEDHSIVLANGTEATPSQVAVGTELLHNNQMYKQIVPKATTISENEAYVMGFFVADGSADVYNCPSGVKASWAINKADMELLKDAQAKCPFNTNILDTIASSGVYKLVPVGCITEQARRYRQLFYNQHREKIVPTEILNAPINVAQAFWDGFYAGDGDKDKNGYVRFDQKGKEIGAGMCILAQRLGYSVSINDRASKDRVFRYTMTTKKQRKNPNAIKKIYELQHPGPDIYVYDLETDNHHFAVGPGMLVVHNTDSLFVEFNPRNVETGERLTGREARQAAIDLTAEAGHLVTQALKPPHDFEFDKIFDPMLMFSKKRYAGLMFENNADEFVHKYMGIALKRRDNAPIVKTIFGGAMKKLLLEKDIIGATMLVKQLCDELVAGKVSLNQLTITKSLRADYADPTRIAHKVLADRIAARDPGNAPASGDRIGFVYIRPKPGQEDAKLQGDRIETPGFVREKGLSADYKFYIEHQIQNPVSQMFGILLESMPGFDCRVMANCPEDSDKRIAWRETVAADILFREALRKCGSNEKQQFVKTFFGGAAVKTVTPSRGLNSAGIVVRTQVKALDSSGGTTTVKKQVQSSISNYILDSMIISSMSKRKKDKDSASNSTNNKTK
jgi:DNA polymerase elongation subunit (family B)